MEGLHAVGVQVSNIQVYQVNTGKFNCIIKYKYIPGKDTVNHQVRSQVEGLQTLGVEFSII